MIRELQDEQQNNVPEFEGNVLRIQHVLLAARRNRQLSMQAVLSGSLLFSYSGKNKDGTDRLCTRTYAAMAAELGCSKSSIARSIAELKAGEYIERVRQSAYKYTGSDAGFDRFELWFKTAEHKLKDGSVVRFTNSQAVVFAYLYSHKDKHGAVSLTSSELARKLGLNRCTVDGALRLFALAGYISRPKKDRGINRFKKSTWHISEKLLNRRRKSARKAQRQDGEQVIVHKTQAQVEAERQSERAAYDGFTAARRQHAEALADMNKAKAASDAAFKSADRALTGLDINIAFAEVKGQANMPELIAKRRDFKAQRREALKRLQLTEADLLPAYTCPKCCDTGYMDSGGICPKCWAEFKKGRN